MFRHGKKDVPTGKTVQLVYPLKGGLAKGLAETLEQSEETLACMPTGGEALVVTNQRVFILKGGFSSGAFFGRKLKSYAFDQITSLEVSKGALMGRLQISAAGTTEHGQRGLTDAMQAENIVTFGVASSPSSPGHVEFLEVAKLIRRMMAEAKQPKSVASATLSTAEQLEKLADLRGRGVLTEAEFSAAKAKLLGL